jgi:hypothetical protein
LTSRRTLVEFISEDLQHAFGATNSKRSRAGNLSRIVAHRKISILRFSCTALRCAQSALRRHRGAPACQGPPELERATVTHPSVAAFDALGAYFRTAQAILLRHFCNHSALKLDPSSWEAHFNLGLTFLDKGDYRLHWECLRSHSERSENESVGPLYFRWI